MTSAGKIMASLGLSFISLSGLNIMQKYFIDWLNQQFSNFPVNALNLIYIAGAGVALNWIFGAFTFLATFKSISKLAAGISAK